MSCHISTKSSNLWAFLLKQEAGIVRRILPFEKWLVLGVTVQRTCLRNLRYGSVCVWLFGNILLRKIFRRLSEANMWETKQATAKTSELLLKNGPENINAETVTQTRGLSRQHSLRIHGKTEQIQATAEMLGSDRALRWERTEGLGDGSQSWPSRPPFRELSVRGVTWSAIFV